MQVGTQGCVKGLTVEQLQEIDCHIILANTYHLALRCSSAPHLPTSHGHPVHPGGSGPAQHQTHPPLSGYTRAGT